MTDDMIKEFRAFMRRISEKRDADQVLGEAWAKVDAFLEETETPEGGCYGGLEDMIRSHFHCLSDCSRPAISFMRDVDVANGDGRKGCMVMRLEPDAQEDHDFILAEEASYPYVELEGSVYVSVELLDTILDCTRRGYLIDADSTVICDEEMDTPSRKLPRHHSPRKRKAKKQRK